MEQIDDLTMTEFLCKGGLKFNSIKAEAVAGANALKNVVLQSKLFSDGQLL